MRRLLIRGRRLYGLGRPVPVALGRGGVRGDKREGDGATPRTRLRVEAAMHRADRVRGPGRAIGARDLWSDDPRDPAYNTRVVAPHRFSHERLRRGDRLYDLVWVLDWNRHPPVPGRGSAIFAHRWRRPGRPTAGCLGLHPRDLRRLRVGDVIDVR